MINWMDNFNIYGIDGGRVGRMSNGIYAGVSWADLVVDPDATAGGTYVLASTNTNFSSVRKVMPNPRTTMGAAARFWLSALPSATREATYFTFADVSVFPHIAVNVDPSGYFRVYRADTGALLGSSANPVILANAWQHVEAKVFIDVGAIGTVEIRVEGITVVNIAGVRTASAAGGSAASVQNVLLLGGSGNYGATTYVKDFIIWDNTTGFNNNFMGSCQVYKIIPNGDVALNWTPSSGATGFNLINEVTPDDDVNYISAPAPGIPAAYKCSLSDLPVTVTSVRGVMPIHRSRKTDGGDGNIQLGAISGASTGLGADRPITTAYTYWYDVFDTDPATAGAWTRVSVNAMNLQLNRTL
jgi:hypothetical protein